MKDFNIGDRVNYPRFGAGIIKEISASGEIGVVFDTEDSSLHNLHGLCEHHRGWWVLPGEGDLSLVASAKYARLDAEVNAAPAPEPSDNTNPDHYKRGGTETIDYLRAKMTDDDFKGFCRGNALKYISRAPDKNQDEDYRKAI